MRQACVFITVDGRDSSWGSKNFIRLVARKRILNPDFPDLALGFFVFIGWAESTRGKERSFSLCCVKLEMFFRLGLAFAV